jgi:hypothetical protein
LIANPTADTEVKGAKFGPTGTFFAHV